jgi:type I restriction enzyme S subunit
MSFPQYPCYKNSGLEQLGKVPEHWDLTPLKHVASLKGRLGWQGLKAEQYTEEGPFLVTSEHFIEEKIDWSRCHHVAQERYEMAPEIQLHVDDVLMMKDGAAMGKLAYVDALPGPACLNSHLLLFRPVTGRFYNRFLFYVMGGPGFKNYMVQQRTGTTFFGISQESIASFHVALPPMEEQKTILEFLRSETAKIDELTAQQERLITLLKQKRQIVISRAVTKGLNRGTSMKDSGNEWLGEVPQPWQVVRLGALFRETAEPGNEELPVLSVSIHDGVSDREFGEDEQDRKVTRSDDRTKYKRVQPGDLVYNMMRAWQGGFGSVTVLGMVSPAYVVARPVGPIRTEFIEQLLRTPQAIEQLRRHSRGVTDFRLRLYWDEFKSIKVAVPTITEQNEILDRIGRETATLDALIAEAETGITLLQERRVALISAAVTGKIDVRHFRAVARDKDAAA